MARPRGKKATKAPEIVNKCGDCACATWVDLFSNRDREGRPISLTCHMSNNLHRLRTDRACSEYAPGVPRTLPPNKEELERFEAWHKSDKKLCLGPVERPD